MTAVIYARYSSDNQREESIEGQIRECTAYAEKNGITVIKHYIDRAFSAKTDNRPEFQQMIKDSGKKLFDVVLVWKFDRFARNRFDSANYKMILKKNGVHLISVMEPIAEGSQGILVETLLEGMAEYYSAELSEKRYAYSLGGSRAVDSAPLSKPRNTTILSSIQLDGTLRYTTFSGGTTVEKFKRYLETDLLPHLDGNSVLIMDNMKSHHAKAVKNLLDSFGIRYIYLPPYSPDLNPIEKL